MMSVNQPLGRTSTCVLSDDIFIIGHCADRYLGCVTQVHLFFLSKKMTHALTLGSPKSDVLASRALKIWVGKQPSPGFLYHSGRDLQKAGRETTCGFDVGSTSLPDITSTPDYQCHGSAIYRSTSSL